jgi:hypothetical protein
VNYTFLATMYNAKFNVLVYTYSSVPFCIYLIPNGSNIEHHAC